MADLKSLSPARFNEFTASRERAISASSEKFDLHDDPVNRLAAALHPEVQHLTVQEVVEHGGETKSYICRAEGGVCAYFAAGQYLSVSVEINGIKYSRPYSISSSPKESLDGIYRITVKRVCGGLVSNFILDNFAVGTKFDVSAPAGNFTYEPLRDAKNVIAIAGGSGITPFISMARAIADGDEDLELTILYGCRRVSEILFRDELDTLSAECDKIKVVYVISDEEAEGLEHGFITSSCIRSYAPSGEFSIFACGPEGMIEFLTEELKVLGLRRKFVRLELRGERPLKNVDGEVSLTVHLHGRAVSISGKRSDTILRILENAGITPPTSCRSGECGFCRSRLISGEVFIPDGVDARRAADRKFGYIHPCCTYAVTDLEIAVTS